MNMKEFKRIIHELWVIILAGVAIGLIIGIFLSTPAKSHSWYHFHCCSDKDCGPVLKFDKHPEGDILTSEFGSVLIKKDEQNVYRYPSQDDKFHVCIIDIGGVKVPRCIYYPALY